MKKRAIERMKRANIRKYGSEEAWKAELRRRARKGGQRGGGKAGFRDKAAASAAGKLGAARRWHNGV